MANRDTSVAELAANQGLGACRCIVTLICPVVYGSMEGGSWRVRAYGEKIETDGAGCELSVMNEAQLKAFLKRHPCLYHFAEMGAWKSIRTDGLLSTSALLDRYEIEGESRFALESARRDGMTTLKKTGLPNVVIRDQKPLSDPSLRDCLPPEISPRDWYELLNRKVFFWLSKDRLHRMSRTYGDKRRLVLVLDTEALVVAYTDDIWLSHMNSGCSIPWKAARSYETFRRIADYPYGKRKGKAAELCVDHGVPDVRRFVRSIHEVFGERWGRVVWKR